MPKFNWGTLKNVFKTTGNLDKLNKAADALGKLASKEAGKKAAADGFKFSVGKTASIAAELATAIYACQKMDQVFGAINSIPVVGKVLTFADKVPDWAATYTIGSIPKVGEWFNNYMGWILGDAGASMAELLGMKNWAAHLRQKGATYKAHNSAAWWQEQKFTVQTDEGIFAYPTEGTSGEAAQGSLTIILDELPKQAVRKWGLDTGKIQKAISSAVDKYLKYRNYSQTLTAEVISQYLSGVVDYYETYIMLKKYYNCRNTPIMQGQSYADFTFKNAYMNGAVNLDFSSSRTTHETLKDRYSVIDSYITDKDWDDIDTFISRQYLPTSLKEYIENMYGYFYRYDKQANSLVSIDPYDGHAYYKGNDGYDAAHGIVARLQSYEEYINSVLNSVTASVTGFLAKCGLTTISIPEYFSNKKSKVGQDKIDFVECDDEMRAAIDNALGVSRTGQYSGYKWNETEDTIILATDKTPSLEPSLNPELGEYNLTSEEANYITRLAKFTFKSHFYAASIWGLDHTGNLVAIDWGFKDVRFYLQGLGATYTYQTVRSAMDILEKLTGPTNAPDLFDTANFSTRLDRQVQFVFKGDNTIQVQFEPRFVLGQRDCEIKVHNYSVVMRSAYESIAMSKQYADALDKWVTELNKAIDLQLA